MLRSAPARSRGRGIAGRCEAREAEGQAQPVRSSPGIVVSGVGEALLVGLDPGYALDRACIGIRNAPERRRQRRHGARLATEVGEEQGQGGVTLLDGFRETAEGGTRCVQLRDRAVQPGLAISHPALGPGLHPGQFAVAPRLGEGTHRDGDRRRGDPNDGTEDEGCEEHLPTG